MIQASESNGKNTRNGGGAVKPKLTISFESRFVTIEGGAPKSMAHEICFALAPIFQRHGLGLHLSVLAAPEDQDSEVIAAVVKVVRTSALAGESDLELAVMAAHPVPALAPPDEIAPKHEIGDERKASTVGQERVRRMRREVSVNGNGHRRKP